ncbi:MAG: hypothetical protein IJQ02_11625 [Oscillospiraceae bacterium]|nr:hypothetical protein [Oscillospiraceae bacterium]
MVEIYEWADELGASIFTGILPENESIALPGGYVGLDYTLIEDPPRERCCAGHELGHIAKRAFYRRTDPPFYKRRCEKQADRAFIKRIITKEKIREALRSGCTETWQVAEYLNITEEYAYKAMYYYKNGNMNYDRPGY